MESQVQNKYRYERKLIVPDIYIDNVSNLIYNNPAIFREIYSKRKINNIYLDTPDHRFYNENIDGLAVRKKIRVRWYGDIYGDSIATLEIKNKFGSVGNKKSFKIHKFNFNQELNIIEFRDMILKSDIPFDIKADLRSLDFSLLNSYSRNYFLSLDNKIRLTLDSDINYYNIYNYNGNKFNPPNAHQNINIIEAKYSKNNDYLAENIINHFPFRLTRISKYVQGVNYIRGLY